jgi:hypothetical protein
MERRMSHRKRWMPELVQQFPPKVCVDDGGDSDDDADTVVYMPEAAAVGVAAGATETKNPEQESESDSVSSASSGDASGDDDVYDVEAIRKARTGRNGMREYLVKWLGYPERSNSWLPASHFRGLDMITEFERTTAAGRPLRKRRRVRR